MPERLVGWLRLRAWTPRRIWSTGFLAFFFLAAAWALATPLTAVPDEPAHIIKAAATVRGELNGVPVSDTITYEGVDYTSVLTGYRVPKGYTKLTHMHDCYFTLGHVPASCAAPISGGSEDGIAGTSAAANNPAYYLAVGWPSLIFKGSAGIYLMRLVSAAICSALLASALVTASQWRRGRTYLVYGLLVAVTPMALFLNGSVNPNSVEISSGTLLWTAAIALLTDPQPEFVRGRLARAGLAAMALVSVRQLGPLWVLGMLVCAVLAGQPGALRGLLRTRLTHVWAAFATLTAVGAFAWSARNNVLITSAVAHPDLTFWPAARYTFGQTLHFLDAMIGWFGWLDVAPPTPTRWIWQVIVIAMLAAGLRAGRPRERAALVCLAVAVVAIPILAQAKQAQYLGYIWQGRYLMAIGAGLPLLAAAVMARKAPSFVQNRERWILATAAAAMGISSLAMFYATLRRYAVGTGGPLFSWNPAWSPPGGILTVVSVYLIGLTLIGWICQAVCSGERLPRRDTATIAPDRVPEDLLAPALAVSGEGR